MQKIMFDNRFLLTQAVLEEWKTKTRRIMKPQPKDCSDIHKHYVKAKWCNEPMRLMVDEYGYACCSLCGYGVVRKGKPLFKAPYKKGEIVAIAQCYKDLGGFMPDGTPRWEYISKMVGNKNAGWDNKMFVKPELMVNFVRMTDLFAQRLQDISDEDCLAEGIINMPDGCGLKPYAFYDKSIKVKSEKEGINYGWYRDFNTPREAYSVLIDKMNSKGRNKTFRRRSNSWNFYQLRSFLEYKCKMNGVQITVIPPAYTSQTCHECGHIGIRNGKHFRCVHCGNVADADVNAALNIATWGYVNTHERWELLSCPIHDDYSTSKAHKSLVCG